MGANETASTTRVRVLVIGCGFLGGHIARGLASRGTQVRVLSRSFAPGVAGLLPRGSLIQADARDRPALEAALRNVDEVVFCIGGLQPAGAQRHPDLDAAMLLEPLRAVVAALRPRPGIRLTYLSSGGAVYGNPDHIPVGEDDLPKPIGAYAAVRLAGEEIVGAARDWDGTAVLILRCANVYGEYQPLDRGQGAVGVFLDRISRGQPIEVFGDGATVRDYVYVGDLVDAVAYLLVRRGGPALLNMGSGMGTSVAELIECVEEIVGRRAIAVHRPARSFDVERVILDVTRLRRLVPFHPRPIAAGIALLAGSGRVRANARRREPLQASR